MLGLISQVRVFGTEQLPFLYPFVSNLLSYIQIQRKVNVKPRTNNKPFYTSFKYILSRREKTSHTESSTDFSLTIPISLINKNTLTAVFSLLARRLDREMRRLILHETGFTGQRFFTSYFIEGDTFYLFLNWLSTRVSDDRKYVCGRRLYACINTRKFQGLDSRQFTSLPGIKKVIYMAHHFNHRWN